MNQPLRRCYAPVLAFGALLAVSAAHAADWPQWRGPDRTGISKETGLNTDWKTNPPKLLWMVDGMGSGYAGVSIAGDRIFTTGNTGQGQAVVALNKADGKILWRTPLTDSDPRHGYDGSRCTPSIDGDRLYVVTSNGQIACLKVADGSVVWKKDFKKEWGGRMMSGWGYSESPLVDGDWVLCTPGAHDAMIVALDKLTGKEIWRSKAGPKGEQGKDGAGYSSIVVSNGGGVKQYVQMTGRGAIGVRAKDGEFLWAYHRVANKTANIPTPIVSGDYVFCSTGYRDGGSALLRLKQDGEGVTAEEVYYKNGAELQNHHGGMVLIDGHIYCGHGHNKGFPVCVELKSGDLAWGGRIRGPGKGSAAVKFVDGHVIFRYQDGVVAIIEATPAGYKLKGSFKPAFQQGRSWAHPVVSDGKLYLREQDKLMCYDVSGA